MKTTLTGVSSALINTAQSLLAPQISAFSAAPSSDAPLSTAPLSNTLAPSNAVHTHGTTMLMEAVFADISASDLAQALDDSGIKWRAADGTPTLEITEIETAAGTIRTFLAGYFPAEALESLTALTGGQSAGYFMGAQPIAFATSVGTVTTQGDAAQESDDARANYNVDGTGVTVGILSDSFGAEVGADGTTPTATSVADDVTSGDLPAGVIILADSNSPLSTDGDEGRAMAQLVHDVAPGATLAFHTANNGQGAFAQGILDLRTSVADGGAGADVIVDDIIYFAEAIFQDGVVAQAATQVVNDGAVFLSSAGNNGDDGFYDDFRDSGIDGSTITVLSGLAGGAALGTLHDWNPDEAATSLYVEITVPVDGLFDLSFQWDDPFASAGGAGATSDLDIFLTEVDSETGTETLLDSGFSNNIGGDAVEIVGLENTSGAVMTVRIYVTEFDPSEVTENAQIAGIFFADASGDFEDVYTPQILDADGALIAAPQFGGPTVYGHSNAEGALAVGAAAYFNTAPFGLSTARLNGFSSRGGFDIYYDALGNRLAEVDERDGVDFVAPDGGNTTFFGSDADGDEFPNFFGTSAAAPHAAGVVALMLERNHTLTPAEVEAILEGSTTAVTRDGISDPDFVGAGLINADAALANTTAIGNAAPVAQDDIFTDQNEDTPLIADVLADNTNGVDADGDGDTLSVTALNGDVSLVGVSAVLASGATLTLLANGTFTYVAAASLGLSETATDSFTYTISDGNGGTDTATVSIGLIGANDTPAVMPDTGAVLNNGTITDLDVLGNDTDPDTNDTLSVASIDSSATLGLVTLNEDGTIDYDPNGAFDALTPGQTSTDSFSYTVTDGNGGTETAAVTLTITGANALPIADADTAATDQNTALESIDVLSNDSDADEGDTLTISSFDASGTLGTVTQNEDGTFAYDPNSAFISLGLDESAADSFTYTITDGNDGFSTATVTLTITGLNDGPTANADAATTNADTAIGAVDVLDNDTDPDNGDTLTILSFDASAALGLVTLNEDGTFAYDPNGAFIGLGLNQSATDSFTYTAEDGAGAQSTATVTLTLQGQNEDPVAQDDDAATDAETALSNIVLLTNDTDPDVTDTLSVVSIETATTIGQVTLNQDGTVNYDPNGAFSGLIADQTATDRFTYTVSDGNGGTNVATVAILITGLNDAPIAQDDAASTTAETALGAILVLENDTDADDGQTPTIASFDASATLGLVTLNENGSFAYDPNGAFEDLESGTVAEDQFTYTITDGVETSTGTVTITITGTALLISLSDEATTTKFTPVDIDVLANDGVNAVGDVAVVGFDTTQTVGKLVSLTAEGIFSYDPNGAFDDLAEGDVGVDQFTYTVVDDAGTFDTSTVYINVLGALFQTFTGTDLADQLDGSLRGDEIYGLVGNDTLNGLDGDDTIFGNEDDDVITGGAGADLIEGGDGNDLLYGDDIEAAASAAAALHVAASTGLDDLGL